MILETFTRLVGDELQLPGFLEISHEITGDATYSMYYLSSNDACLPSHPTSKPVKSVTTNGVASNGLEHGCHA